MADYRLSSFEENQFDLYGPTSNFNYCAPSAILRHTASRVEQLMESNRKAATEEKASVILDSPDITPTPHPQAAPRSSHFSSDSAKLSLSDMESDKRNSKSSLPPNSPAPDTMQHFAETYIAATKIWCAAAVRFARHLHDQDTKARSKRASLDLENNLSTKFLVSQELVLTEVRELCKNFRTTMPECGGDTPTDINRLVLETIRWQVKLGQRFSLPHAENLDFAEKDRLIREQQEAEEESKAQSDSDEGHVVWGCGRHSFREVTERAPRLSRGKGSRLVSLRVLRNRRIVQMSCCVEQMMYLTQDGVVFQSWSSVGAGSKPKAVQDLVLYKMEERKSIGSVCCGSNHSVALTTAGEVFCWGKGQYGVLGHGSERDWPNPHLCVALSGIAVKQVNCGSSHTVALANDAVYTWGKGTNGRLGHGNEAHHSIPTELKWLPAILASIRQQEDMASLSSSFGSAYTSLASDRPTPGRRIVQAACGWNFTFIRDDIGHLYMFGQGMDGQSGIVPRKDHLSPVALDFPSFLTSDVVCGYNHVLAIDKRTGTLYSWGQGDNGQLGHGPTRKEVRTPEPVHFSSSVPKRKRGNSLTPRICQIWTGMFHSFAIDVNKHLYAWGLNSQGQLGLGDTRNRHTPARVSSPLMRDNDIFHIAASQDFTLILASSRGKEMPSPPGASTALARKNSSGHGIVGDYDEPGADALDQNSNKSYVPSILFKRSLRVRAGRSPSSRRVLSRSEGLRRNKNEELWHTTLLPRLLKEGRLSKQVKREWRCGVPKVLRRLCWPLVIGDNLSISEEYYELERKKAESDFKLLEAQEKSQSELYPSSPRYAMNKNSTFAMQLNSAKTIIGDVRRTFQETEIFSASSGDYGRRLTSVLLTYWGYRKDIGYVQGMSYPCAVLVLNSTSEYSAFSMFANLMNQHPHFFHYLKMDRKRMRKYTDVAFNVLKIHVRLSYQVLIHHDIDLEMLLIKWLVPVFLKVLPWKICARIWDNFLWDGIPFLYKVVVAIFKLLLPVLQAYKNDSGEIFGLLHYTEGSGNCREKYRRSWKDLVTYDALFRETRAITFSNEVQKQIKLLNKTNA